jgi:hypothetical protein
MQTTPRTKPVIPFLNSDENRGQCRHDDKTQPFAGNEQNMVAETLRKAGDAHVIEIAMETDHTYADHRIALQVAVLNWLQSLGVLQGK